MIRSRGFTLIELMIVVAIIAIIAAIAIPSLLRSRIAANEQSAASGLKMLVSVNAVWRSTDADGNGVKDYLTANSHHLGDFFHQTNRAGQPVKLIDVAFAKADMDNSWTLHPKSGYIFVAFGPDENGSQYSRHARYSFAFAAVAAEYGTTGVRAFLVNQEGVVYSRDVGDVLQVGAGLDSWPGTDPTINGWAVEGE